MSKMSLKYSCNDMKQYARYAVQISKSQSSSMLVVFFVECSGNTFGVNCTSQCDCIANNTVDAAQSCNHVTGICECQRGWEGTKCEMDIDECASSPGPCTEPNTGCHNVDGSYTCSCLRGYENSTGTCIASKSSNACTLPMWSLLGCFFVLCAFVCF